MLCSLQMRILLQDKENDVYRYLSQSLKASKISTYSLARQEHSYRPTPKRRQNFRSSRVVDIPTSDRWYQTYTGRSLK